MVSVSYCPLSSDPTVVSRPNRPGFRGGGARSFPAIHPARPQARRQQTVLGRLGIGQASPPLQLHRRRGPFVPPAQACMAAGRTSAARRALSALAARGFSAAAPAAAVPAAAVATSHSPSPETWGSRSPWVRDQQRRRSSVAAGAAKSKSDLLSIANVGAKSAELLSDAGIPDLSTLRSWYADRAEAGKGKEEAKEELRELVASVQHKAGVKVTSLRKNAAASLVNWCDQQMDVQQEENQTQTRALKKAGSGLTLCVEGNIGVGKTTFLQKLMKVELQEVVEVVPEPVEKWQDVGSDHVNLLELFYQDQTRYAYTFQHYVFVTRMMQERESREQLRAANKDLRLLERSVFSDRMVFVRAVHEAQCMSDAELSVYDSWFSPMIQAIPNLIPDGFIYLRASPQTCLQRMMGRGRDEEAMVPLDYLENLHEKHEEWLGTNEPYVKHANVLYPHQHEEPGTLLATSSPLNSTPVPDILQGKLMQLKAPKGVHLPQAVSTRPALCLDYDENIDLDNNHEAKREYAKTVTAYMQFIKAHKAESLERSLIVPSPAQIAEIHRQEAKMQASI